MARKQRKGRPVHGVLAYDKPPGWSSNQALQQVKRLFFASKAGHTGSLDPLATGLLLICFGNATKISNYLLNADKAYTTSCKLGEKTTTADSEGEIIQSRDVPELDVAQVNTVLKQFTGEIQQIPPMYSALRQNGKRLYELARAGVEVEREPRTVQIHSLQLSNMTRDSLELEIECSKGTYVRTLVEDIGEALGCGAHVARLRRTRVGPVTAQGMIEHSELQALAEQGYSALDSRLMPIDSALSDRPAVQVNDDLAQYLGSGQPVLVPNLPSSDIYRLYTNGQIYLGIGTRLDDGRVSLKHGTCSPVVKQV